MREQLEGQTCAAARSVRSGAYPGQGLERNPDDQRGSGRESFLQYAPGYLRPSRYAEGIRGLVHRLPKEGFRNKGLSGLPAQGRPQARLRLGQRVREVGRGERQAAQGIDGEGRIDQEVACAFSTLLPLRC